MATKHWTTIGAIASALGAAVAVIQYFGMGIQLDRSSSADNSVEQKSIGDCPSNIVGDGNTYVCEKGAKKSHDLPKKVTTALLEVLRAARESLNCDLNDEGVVDSIDLLKSLEYFADTKDPDVRRHRYHLAVTCRALSELSRGNYTYMDSFSRMTPGNIVDERDTDNRLNAAMVIAASVVLSVDEQNQESALSLLDYAKRQVIEGGSGVNLELISIARSLTYVLFRQCNKADIELEKLDKFAEQLKDGRPLSILTKARALAAECES